MNLVIIGGFLGSGKTTILLSVARYLSEYKSLKVAIIENEIGKVGIDGEHIKEQGLEVKEIYSGCICCSLRSDIIQTLLALERESNPDVVLLEPSGVANPTEVLKSLDGYGGNIEQKQVITIVDPVRFTQLEDYSMPLITNSIHQTNLLVINKIDLVSSDTIKTLEEKIRNIRHDVNIIHATEKQEDTFKEIHENVLPKLETENQKFTIETSEQKINTHENAVTYAREIQLEFSKDLNREHIEEDVFKLLNNISNLLNKNGCHLIGHIKAIIKAKNKGYLVLSKTSFEHPPQSKGKLSKSLSNAKFIINLIVYGIKKEELQKITDNEIDKHF